jgi:hypothetical protein
LLLLNSNRIILSQIKGDSMKSIGSASINILRVALLLIFLGLFLPLGCKSNGFQVAQGILGNTDLGKGAIILESINDFYAYLLFAVFILAAIGFVITFISNVNSSSILAFLCLIVSLVFMIIILMKLKVYFDFKEFAFYVKIAVPIKIELLIGGYFMIIGYIGGILAFILNKLKIIE